MRLRNFAMCVGLCLLWASPAYATTSIFPEAQGATGWTMDFCKDSVTGNLRQCTYLLDPATALPFSPFAAGGSIGNSSFGISGTLPAFASTPAFTISGTLPAFAATQTFNLGTLNGAATAAGVATINTTLGAPMQNSGGTVGLSGTLPAFAATPTFNLGTLNGAATAALQPTNAAQGSTTSGQTGRLDLGAVTTSTPSYTTGQTSPLSLDPNGNLRVNVTTGGVSGNVSQGSTTSGNTGPMVQGAVTTAAPSYTTAQTSPLSLTPAGELRVNASASAIQGGAPGVAVASGNTVSVQNPSLDPCQTQVSNYTPISMVTATTLKIATGVAAKKIYVCSLFLYAGGADNVAIIEGTTATTCGTAPLGVSGGATAATGFLLVANQGLPFGNGASYTMATSVANNDLCLITSAAVQLSGGVKWVTF